MYYRLHQSLDKKLLGVFPQTIFAQFGVPMDHPDNLFSHYAKKVADPDTVIVPQPVLEKNAKHTDLITNLYAAGRLIISDLLKKILDKTGSAGLQFFPTNLIDKSSTVPGYWIVTTFAYDYGAIDFSASRFSIHELGANRISIEIANANEFLSIVNQTAYPKGISIDTLFFLPDLKADLLLLRYVYGGVGYFVSEKLKKEIEDAGCTGIVFTKPEERHP